MYHESPLGCTHDRIRLWRSQVTDLMFSVGELEKIRALQHHHPVVLLCIDPVRAGLPRR